MEEKPKTVVYALDEDLDEEINKLDIEVIPNPKIDNIKSDLTFKIIIIGNPSVGKNILSLPLRSNEDSYTATVGFDFQSFLVKIENLLIRLQIWETCGQEGYRSLAQNFYRGTALAIFVYAINDIESFNDIPTWIKQLKEYSSQDTKMILFGNKNDLVNERKISEEEGRILGEDFGFKYFYETSEKSGFNINEFYIKVAKLLYNNYKNYNSGLKYSPGLNKKIRNKKLNYSTRKFLDKNIFKFLYY